MPYIRELLSGKINLWGQGLSHAPCAVHSCLSCVPHAHVQEQELQLCEAYYKADKSLQVKSCPLCYCSVSCSSTIERIPCPEDCAADTKKHMHRPQHMVTLWGEEGLAILAFAGRAADAADNHWE